MHLAGKWTCDPADCFVECHLGRIELLVNGREMLGLFHN